MRIEAAIFDLDGVISKTAIKHAIAWKILFDRFLGNTVKIIVRTILNSILEMTT